MNKQFLIISGVVILAVSLYFSVARAADVPSWWIGSKADYEKLVQAAKKEGNVVWWSHPDPECNRIVTGPFTKEYGITVEHTEYTSSQIVQRVILEGASKVYTVDVANLSVHHVPRLEKNGLLKKLPYTESGSARTTISRRLSVPTALPSSAGPPRVASPTTRRKYPKRNFPTAMRICSILNGRVESAWTTT